MSEKISLDSSEDTTEPPDMVALTPLWFDVEFQ